jgi:hypothetical protein
MNVERCVIGAMAIRVWWWYRHPPPMEELKEQIEEFIEAFYNQQRLHSALQYLTPEEYEKLSQTADPKRPLPPAALNFLSIRKSTLMPSAPPPSA